MPLKVKPSFNRREQTLIFPVAETNSFAREQIYDNFSFYQRQFGIFQWMPMTKKMKYVIHSAKATPFVWQKNQSCSWEPTGSLRMDRQEITPCDAKINEQHCWDELMDECFKHLFTWSASGAKTLDATAEALINQFTEILLENYTYGAYLTLTAGGLFNFTDQTFRDDVSNDLRSLMKKTNSACRGWLPLLKDTADQGSTFQHLNLPGYFTASMFDGKEFIGDVVALKDELVAKAKPEMRKALNVGGVNGRAVNGIVPSAVWLVSDSINNRAAQQYNEQSVLNVSTIMFQPRLTRREFTNGGATIYVYYVDNVPLIPIDAVSEYDQYLEGGYHFSYLTMGRNIGLGGSFGEIPDIATNQVGIRIQRGTSNAELGKYFILSEAMFANAIADVRYVVGSQIYAE